MNDLLTVAPSIDQLARIIGNVAAPAFLLGGVASFISVLTTRMNRVIDRSQVLHGIVDGDSSRAYLKADIPRLKQQASLLNRSLFYSILSAILTGLIIIVAFISAVLRVPQGAGLLFTGALGSFFFR